jgi:hypothetical protein
MRILTALLAAYTGASLLHFVHNAEFLADYPNMPSSISRAAVYWTWLGQACIGAAGYALLLRGFRAAGLSLIALYALLGFDGLLHYLLAPLAAHSVAMNLTIWSEVAAAAALLAVTVRQLRTGRA